MATWLIDRGSRDRGFPPKHPLRRALGEMLGGRDPTGRTAPSDPDEMEVRVVALMMAEGLAPPG